MRKQVSVSENGSVGTLARGLDVLELFASSAPELSQKQISDTLGLPMPTVHRLTALLTERGWLDRDPVTRRLRLGLEMARLVPALMAGMRLPELARPHLLRLASDVQRDRERRDPRGPDVVYLLSESGDRLLTSNVLDRHATARPLHRARQVPAGAAARGRRPERARARALRAADRPHADDLARARRRTSPRSATPESPSRRRSTSWGSSRSPCRSAGPTAPAPAAINVSLPAGRATPEFREQLTKGLLAAPRRRSTGRWAAPGVRP